MTDFQKLYGQMSASAGHLSVYKMFGGVELFAYGYDFWTLYAICF